MSASGAVAAVRAVKDDVSFSAEERTRRGRADHDKQSQPMSLGRDSVQPADSFSQEVVAHRPPIVTLGNEAIYSTFAGGPFSDPKLATIS